ncbi:hypothetical protein BC937DRAFT_88907 [Endogone sp. FLAS-F59071]|nr:hypothetical protein BC937DRAFT_88907 [Endogone sp. FLAS-F59071]|eukprot:RUS18339.1 hypothetical protein BC937DRAFT_88907 [Endogone sp. FLAS-F59071]
MMRCLFLRPQQPDTINFADLTPEFFQRRYRNIRPLLIRNAISSDALAKFANGPYMAEQIREREGVSPGASVKAMVAKDNINFMDNELFVDKVDVEADTLFASILGPFARSGEESLNSQPHLYYRGLLSDSLLQTLAISTLLQPISLPTTAITVNSSLVRLWASHAGCTTPLHYDRCHGLLAQLHGRKRFVVFSHEDTRSLYPYDGITGPTHASRLRELGTCFAYPGERAEEAGTREARTAELLRRWGKVAGTEPWVIDLEAGDVLYTPVGFWHEVTSLTASISVTVPWDMSKSEKEDLPAHMAF